MDLRTLEITDTDYKHYDSISRAVKSGNKVVSISFRSSKFVSFPKNYGMLNSFDKLELNLSHNGKTIDLEKTFSQLKDFSNTASLGLMSNRIIELPDSIQLIDSLEQLDLCYNKGLAFPHDVSKLKKLKYLNLNSCNLNVIPEAIFELENLEVLKIDNNKLATIPSSISKLKNLKKLSLRGNSLSVLPSEIVHLENLEMLDISKNKFTFIPDSLSSIKTLDSLYFEENDLSIEDVFSKLNENLRTLTLRGESFTTLPKSLERFKNIESIVLSDTKISSLPRMDRDFEKLRKLEINQSTEIDALSKFSFFARCPLIDKLTGEHQTWNKIPDEIEDWKNLKEISLYNQTIEYISSNVGSLKYLKVFDIKSYSNEKLITLPDTFEQLETFAVTGFKKLANFPSNLNMNLTSLEWSGNAYKLKTKDIENFKQLENLSIEVEDSFDIECLSSFSLLKSLTLISTTIKCLPQGLADLKHLKSFSFYSLPNLDTNDALKKLPNLQTLNLKNENLDTFPTKLFELRELRTLYFYNYEKSLKWDDLFKVIENNPYLENFSAYIDLAHISDDFLILNRLKSATIYFISGTKKSITFSPSIVHLDLSKVSLNHFSHEVIKLIRKIQTFNLETKREKEMAFALLSSSFIGVEQFTANPFNENIAGLRFAILGNPTISKLSDLKKDIKELGATLESKITEDTDFIFVTGNQKEEQIVEIVKWNKKLVFEDDFQTEKFKEDTPFILQDSSSELTDQITRLLRNEVEDNTVLVLEIIEGGGANKTLLSYLLVIHLFSQDIEIRKKARGIFKKFASSALLMHVKLKWKDSLRKKAVDDSSIMNGLLNHSEIDLFDAIFAFKMMKFHETKDWSWHSSLVLREFSKESFSPSIQNLDFVKSIYIYGNKNVVFDFEKSYSFIKDFNLEEFSLTESALESFPPSILKMKSLKSLSFSIWNRTLKMELPDMSSLSKLERFSVHGYILKNIQGINTLNPNLTSLSLNHAGLEVFPSQLERFHNLSELNLGHNLISKINFDFSKLIKLSSLHIFNNPLKELPDSFANCGKLTSITFENCELEYIPQSLLSIKLDTEFGSINLRLGNNKIKGLRGQSWISSLFSNKKKETSRYENINLENNLLESIPEEFYLLDIRQLTLRKNPIISLDKIPPTVTMLFLEQTNITSVKAEIFGHKGIVDISNDNNKIELPNPDDVPAYYGRKSFHFSNMSDYDRTVIEAINKKRID